MKPHIFLVATAAALTTWAATAATPADALSLQVSGKLAHAAPVKLTTSALEQLPQHSFRTASPWIKEVRTYSGPLLRDVLKHVGAKGTSIKAVALNDYQITIPVEDALRHAVIVATRIDGQPIPVREFGPMMVVYPFDQHAELRSTRYYERSIWQLKSVKID